MFEQLVAVLLFGLGIFRPGGQGMVAGLADERSRTVATSSAPATVNRELKEAREKGLSASASARTAFQQKLNTIRDAKKKERAERLNTNLNEVNKKRTEALMKFLDRVSEIFTKVQNRAANAKAAGKDTSKVDAAIAKAQADIATAKSAILAQAAKQYTATITSENALRNDMGTAMKQLQSDLGKVKDVVTQAHKSVSEAVKALASALGESLTTKPATASGVRK